MAWLLGYTWADGCVCQPRGSKRWQLVLHYGCQLSDKHLLEQIKHLLNSHHKICQNEHRNEVQLSISSDILGSDLINIHGVMPRKSHLNCPFPLVPPEFLPHFVRGYLDGDGCVYCDYKPTGTMAVRFYGTRNFTRGLRESIAKQIGIRLPTVRCLQRRVYQIGWYAQSDVRKLYKWMYPNENVPCLRRKRDRMKSA